MWNLCQKLNFQFLSNQSIAYQINCNMKNLDFNSIWIPFAIYIYILKFLYPWDPLQEQRWPPVKRLMYMGWCASLIKICVHTLIGTLLYIEVALNVRLKLVFFYPNVQCWRMAITTIYWSLRVHHIYGWHWTALFPFSIYSSGNLTAKLGWLVDIGLGRRDTLASTLLYYISVLPGCWNIYRWSSQKPKSK